MRRPLTPLRDRVWAKVNITPSTTFEECWHWMGAKSTKRRGQKRPTIREAGRGSRTLSVARLVCEWHNGPPPTPYHEAGHTCPNGECDDCINPRHLAWQTREENEQHKQESRRRLATKETTDEDDQLSQAIAAGPFTDDQAGVVGEVGTPSQRDQPLRPHPPLPQA